MDVLDLVDEARPEVDPIPHAARRRIRERLFNTGARPERAPVMQPQPVTPRLRRRARQVVSGFVVLFLFAGLAFGLTRILDSDDAAPAETTPITAAAPTTTTPAPTTAPTSEPASQLPVSFTPLLPAAPEGYELLWAHFDGPSAADSVGLARYVAPGTGTELGIVLQPDGGLFAGPPPEGLATWEVDGRTVRAGGDGTCGGSACSVDVQWDDQTALSLSWVDFDGAVIPETATHDSLLQLLGTLSARAEAWEAGPIDPASPSWDTPSAQHAALLLPPEADQVIDARHRPAWPGTASAVFLAPDRTVVGIQEGDGPELPLDLAESRQIGDVTIAPLDPESSAPAYGIEVTCGFARLHDETGQPPYRPTLVELVERMTLDRGSIGIELPAGWSLIDDGPGGDVFETQFTVDLLGDDTVLTLVQSPAGSPASLMYGGRAFEPITFGEGGAWLHQDGDSAEIAVVAQRAGTAYELSGDGVTVDDLAAVLGALVPSTTAGWVERFGPLDTAEVDITCPQQPSLRVEAP